MKTSICFAFLLLGWSAHAKSAHPCAAEAVKQAGLLLQFHASHAAAAETGVEDSVKVLAPLRNPASRRQSFDVLEVQGHVYRANYQMRLIYARLPGNCVLMGQEIIERSIL